MVSWPLFAVGEYFIESSRSAVGNLGWVFLAMNKLGQCQKKG